MMKKVYLMNGLAVAAMALAATSCSRDLGGGMSYSKEDQIANAELALGLELDPDQDWNMTQTVNAAITVNDEYGETYTVKIYSNDPLLEGVGKVLTKGKIENGKTFNAEFSCGKSDKSLIVAVVNSKGFTTYRNVSIVEGKMEAAFGTAATRAARRSATSPEVPDISTIPDVAYANSYLEGATEPNSDNVYDDYDNSCWKDSGESNNIDWNNEQDLTDRNTFYSSGMSWDQQVAWALEHRPTWVYYWKDETYVTKFKIEGEYTGNIDVFGRRPTSMYVSGTWTLSNDNGNANANYIVSQSANAGSVIVVASGGTLVIPQYTKLDLTNEARLVVMPGGTVTGGGEIAVHNGNADGLEGYNGGTIDVGTFNNNFGKFYNYGQFKTTLLRGGAAQSNFYNHGVAHITRSGVADNQGGGNYENANTRIYNACQWYCEEDMHVYVLEMTSGSYLYVGGELNVSDGNDETAVNSYVSLGSGALLRAGTLSNNNSSWTGPEDGLAVVELGGISYINWTGLPITSGYFINNIAVSVEDKTIGAGNGQGVDTYVALRDFVLNGHGATGNVFNPIGTETVGNGNAAIVAVGGANINIPRSTNFEAGEKDCTPGYNGVPSSGDPDPDPDPTPDPDPDPDPDPIIITDENHIWSYAFEDTPVGDYDLNDVVIKVSENESDNTKLDLKFVCAGATLNLYVRLYDNWDHYGDNNSSHYTTLSREDGTSEIHDMFGVQRGEMVNTNMGPAASPFVITIDKDDYDRANLPIAIYAENTTWGEVLLAGAGDTPHGVIIPTDWSWPKEKVCVETAYCQTNAADKPAGDKDQSFYSFATAPTGDAEEWYKYPVTKTMNEASIDY